MPADIQKLIQSKDLIISTIQWKGPCLPIHIAKAANLNTIFASAFLSELYGEKRVKMSHMKVGSSSLYYLEGQEAQLENFVSYLNNKEQEAFYLLKREKILSDEKLEPAIRVAIKGLKDFAIPLRVKSNDQEKIFWKHFLILDNEAALIIDSLLNPSKKEEKPKPQLKAPLLQSFPTNPIKTPSEKSVQKTIGKIPEKITQKEVEEKQKDKVEIKLEKEQVELKEKTIKKRKIAEEHKFPKSIKEYLSSKDIELLLVVEEGKKDFFAKVRVDTLFGKQEYYLVSKDKKKITSDDLIVALHKAQLEKMPLLFMATGDIDKKHVNYLKEWRNLVKFEKIKL